MKNIALLLSILITFVSSTHAQEHKHSISGDPDTNVRDSGTSLQLNDDKKWPLDDHTYKFAGKLNERVEKFSSGKAKKAELGDS